MLFIRDICNIVGIYVVGFLGAIDYLLDSEMLLLHGCPAFHRNLTGCRIQNPSARGRLLRNLVSIVSRRQCIFGEHLFRDILWAYYGPMSHFVATGWRRRGGESKVQYYRNKSLSVFKFVSDAKLRKAEREKGITNRIVEGGPWHIRTRGHGAVSFLKESWFRRVM